MGPRKKSKPNPNQTPGSADVLSEDAAKGVFKEQTQKQISQTTKCATRSSNAQLSTPVSSPPNTPRGGLILAEGSVSNDKANSDAQNAPSQDSWHGRTWPRIPKSSAITQIIKESVSAAGLSPSEASEKHGQTVDKIANSKSSAVSFARTLQVSNVTSPINPVATKTHATPVSSNHPLSSHGTTPASLFPHNHSQNLGASQGTEPQATKLHPAGTRVEELVFPSGPKSLTLAPDTSPGWLTWLSRTTPAVKESSSGAPIRQQTPVTSIVDQNVPLQEIIQLSEDTGSLPSGRRTEADTSPVASMSPAGQRRSWLTFWNKTGEAQVASDSQIPDPTSDPGEKRLDTEPADPTLTIPVAEAQDGNLGSWGFWPRSKQAEDNARVRKSSADDNVATASTVVLSKATKPFDIPKVASSKGPTLDQPSAQQAILPSSGKLSASKAPKIHPAQGSGSTAAVANAAPTERPIQTPALPPALSSGPRNVLLPPLKDTFNYAETSGWMQTFTRYFNYTRMPVSKHVHSTHDTFRLRKAIAIGVHGYFPAPLIRTILGQPTGTSIKFADMAENAIHRWTERHGYSCDIAKVALEGEGRIGDRVDLLWKLMLNWLDDIRKADFVFVACHSQGVPVALMLVAKLISFGCINGARIAVCAMAGVNLGPFPEYRSRWMGGAAGELFEFANPRSPVSCDYNAALRTALGFGVKIAYVGSIDDQLVSLEV